MSFAVTDWLRVIKHLALNKADKEAEVRAALTAAESDSDLEAEVKAVLDQLDSIRDAIATERNNPNSALVKADVLEWEAGKRTDGMNLERQELRLYLASLLNISIASPDRVVGPTTIRMVSYG